MKKLITSILILVSVLGFSQEKYDLLLDKKKATTFSQENELERACQIYYLETLDSLSFVIYNYYLRFEFRGDSVLNSSYNAIMGTCKMSFNGSDDGTYNAVLHKIDGQSYIIKFVQDNDFFHYYFFYRRWEFLEPLWPKNSREIIKNSSVPSTVGNSN